MKTHKIEDFARYYSTPEKVRVALINTYGNAPPMAKIERVFEEVRKERKGRDVGEPTEKDGLDYAPRSLGWVHSVRFAKIDDSARILTDLRKKDAEELKAERAAIKARQDEDAATVRRAARKLPFGHKLLWEVCDELGLEFDTAKGPGRSRPYVHARALVAVLLKEKDPVHYSNLVIAKILGRTDHSTIIHATKSFDIYCKTNPALHPLYKALGGKW